LVRRVDWLACIGKIKGFWAVIFSGALARLMGPRVIKRLRGPFALQSKAVKLSAFRQRPAN
jgi:hypothetical protein